MKFTLPTGVLGSEDQRAGYIQTHRRRSLMFLSPSNTQFPGRKSRNGRM